jgi:hypothetical protein
MAWERHENNIYDKITHWFEVIGKVLQDPAIRLDPRSRNVTHVTVSHMSHS